MIDAVKFIFFRRVLLVVGLLVFLPVLSISCSAETDVELAERFSPVFYFEGEETCYPVDVSFFIENSYFYDDDGQVISDSPTDYLLSGYSTDDYSFYYLDNMLGSVDDNGIISNYQGNEGSLGYSVYYNVVDYGANSKVVQYWMFYVFNKGHLNQHEGDWELVQVVFENDVPTWVAYSQHYSGQRATWDQVEKDGDHIKVYVARGSHANFLRSYSGKLGASNDFVGDNGKVLKSGSYSLESFSGNSWVDFSGHWGELGEDVAESATMSALGRAGPFGPKYRADGEMWNAPVSWGNSLPEADNNMFLLEWFIYNFFMIFILITLISLALTFVFIYRRHKKYGLGPRIVSMLYIDGFNLKSIGNILCFVGIIFLILGLISPWYVVSYDTSELELSKDLQTSGMADMIRIDGVDGVQIVTPGQNGFSPMGTASIPFSLFIGIGLVFMILSAIGVSHSKKLGRKYINRGIRFMIPIIFIIISIIVLSSLIPVDAMGNNQAGNSIGDVISSISTSPFGSEKTFDISVSEGVTTPLKMKWGLGIGAQLILLSGILIIIAGVLEIRANAEFFQTKIPVIKRGLFGKKSQPVPMMQQPPFQAQEMPQPNQQQVVPPPPPQSSVSESQEKDDFSFCTECGAKLEKDTVFCTECGKKLK